MKKSEITETYIKSIQLKVELTAIKLMVFNKSEFIEYKYFNIDSLGESNYLVFGLYNSAFNCWNVATYDCEHDAIDFRLHRVKAINE